MRVLHRDMKAGEVKLRIENPDDLWHVHNLVAAGDRVRASTYRREEGQADKLRPDRMEKVRVTLTVHVERTEFQAFTDRLRISGIIVEGPQDLGRHHTLNLAVDDVLTIIKAAWKPHELRRIDEAVAAAQRPRVSFLALDDEEALVAQLRQYGVQGLATIRAPGHGKMFATGDAKSVFFDEIRGTLRATDLGERLIIVGPGFARDEFAAFIREREPGIGEKLHVHGTSSAGMRGIHEALRSGIASKVLEASRVALETDLVERLLEAIATGRPCAYGPAEVAEAVDAGAVETLLVLEARVREPAMEDLLRRAEEQRGTVVLVSGHHEAGDKLEALGGIGALLRYAIK